MAPTRRQRQPDLCMVSVTAGSNMHIIPEYKKYLFTSATDILAYKYIFDYAESLGKPCVINYSMGGTEDLWQSNLSNDAISALVGPGKILCASAGNDARHGNYIYKAQGVEKKGAFLMGSAKTNAYLLSSTEYPEVNLTFYPKNEEKIEWTYDAGRLRDYPDSLYVDTLQFEGRKICVQVMAYPSWVDELRTATDIIIETEEKNVLGTALPVALTITGASNEIEAFAQRTTCFIKDARDASLCDFDNTHCINVPGSCDDVICVGAVAGLDSQTKGVRCDFSSIGPNKQGAIKPDVMAPGQNVISAMNSYFYEALSETDGLQENVADKFDYNGRT